MRAAVGSCMKDGKGVGCNSQGIRSILTPRSRSARNLSDLRERSAGLREKHIFNIFLEASATPYLFRFGGSPSPGWTRNSRAAA